jgi:hypothetical protein
MSEKDNAIIQFLKAHGFNKASTDEKYMKRLDSRLKLRGLALDGKWEKIGCHEYYRPYFRQLHNKGISDIIKVR